MEVLRGVMVKHIRGQDYAEYLPMAKEGLTFRWSPSTLLDVAHTIGTV